MDNRRLKRNEKKKEKRSKDTQWKTDTGYPPHWIFSWSRIGASPRCVWASPAVKLLVSFYPGPLALRDHAHVGTCSGKIGRYSTAIHPHEWESNRAMGKHRHLDSEKSIRKSSTNLSLASGNQTWRAGKWTIEIGDFPMKPPI